MVTATLKDPVFHEATVHTWVGFHLSQLRDAIEAAKDGDSKDHAVTRYNWVCEHLKGMGSAYDDMMVRNNIGKGLAVLGIRVPVGFF